MKLYVLNDFKSQDNGNIMKKGAIIEFDKLSDFSRSMGLAFGHIKIVPDDFTTKIIAREHEHQEETEKKMVIQETEVIETQSIEVPVPVRTRKTPSKPKADIKEVKKTRRRSRRKNRDVS